MRVPTLDLKTQNGALKEEILGAIGSVIDSNAFIMGAAVAGLEADVAAYCRSRHCIGVSSGSDALLISLMALDAGPGDEVITTPYTFFATAGAVARVGATPVFVDIDPVTCNIDPAGIEENLTARTKGIIPVHLFGQCAEMDPIMEIARRRGLWVIEDAAQAIGAEYQGQRAGAIGTVGCFSFFPSKNLGAFGDGGAVTTNDDAVAEKLRVLRVHGAKPKYHHRMIGGNFRLDAIQAAVVRVKLKYLDGWTTDRQRIAQSYDVLLSANGLRDTVVHTPRVVHDRHIFNQYVVRVVDRDGLQAHLNEHGIGNAVYYPVPMHLQECFAYLGYGPGSLPESEAAAKSTLAIPLYPTLTPAQQRDVVDCMVDFYAGAGELGIKRAA